MEITYYDFVRHMDDPEMLAFTASLELETVDVKQFFNILSACGKRPVDLETFVVGCIKLRGNAKAIDLQDLLAAQKQVSNYALQTREYCKQQVDILEDLYSTYAALTTREGSDRHLDNELEKI